MELVNYINYAMKSLLKNPILEVLQEIKISRLLKQSNFVKREVGHPPFQILLHFLYMLVMQKRQSSFIKMFAYNIVSYINRTKHEPQTLGELFRDLECELESLAILMQLFIKILTKISEIQNVVKENKNFLQIIAVLSAYTKKELGFMCES